MNFALLSVLSEISNLRNVDYGTKVYKGYCANFVFASVLL